MDSWGPSVVKGSPWRQSGLRVADPLELVLLFEWRLPKLQLPAGPVPLSGPRAGDSAALHSGAGSFSTLSGLAPLLAEPVPYLWFPCDRALRESGHSVFQ